MIGLTKVRKMHKKEAHDLAMFELERVGLVDRAGDYPAQLSGGQKQRVAIARALMNQPALVLADEPTGNLDRETARAVFEVFLGLARERRAAIVIVTHDPELAARCDRVLRLRNGRLAPA
mgnify:CR=1 FL=1